MLIQVICWPWSLLSCKHSSFQKLQRSSIRVFALKKYLLLNIISVKLLTCSFTKDLVETKTSAFSPSFFIPWYRTAQRIRLTLNRFLTSFFGHYGNKTIICVTFFCYVFSAWCPLKGHKYLNKLKLCINMCELSVDRNQVLKGYGVTSDKSVKNN